MTQNVSFCRSQSASFRGWINTALALCVIVASSCGSLKTRPNQSGQTGGNKSSSGGQVYGPVLAGENSGQNTGPNSPANSSAGSSTSPNTNLGQAPNSNYGPTPGQAPAKKRDRIDLLLADSHGAEVFAFIGVLKELRRNKITIGTIYSREETMLAPALFAGSRNLNKLDWHLLQLRKQNDLDIQLREKLLETLKQNDQGMIPWSKLKLYHDDLSDYAVQKLLDQSDSPILLVRLSSQPPSRGLKLLDPSLVQEVVIPMEGIDPAKYVDQGEAIYRGTKTVKDQLKRIQSLLLVNEGM